MDGPPFLLAADQGATFAHAALLQAQYVIVMDRHQLAFDAHRLLFVKDTRVVHFYNKSAGPVFEEVIEKYHRSKSYFFAKHYGRVRHLLYRAATAFLRKHWSRLKGAGFDPPKDLGDLASPPALPAPPDRPVLVEITLDPAYVLAAGHLHGGGAYRMPELTWEALDANTWYLRFLDASSLEVLGTYKWKKTTDPVLPPPYGALKERMP